MRGLLHYGQVIHKDRTTDDIYIEACITPLCSAGGLDIDA